MRILGLTGSIGMGKSSAARALRRLGLPVAESDRVVHDVLGRGCGGVAAFARGFPEAVRAGPGGAAEIDRVKLGARVFGDPGALARLEAIVHPLARRANRRFLNACARRRAPLVALDVPLLFETGGERACDKVVVVSAPAFVQRARVLARPGMDEARLACVLARQMPDRIKRRRADFVVLTGLSKHATLRALRRVVAKMRRAGPRVWRPGHGPGPERIGER